MDLEKVLAQADLVAKTAREAEELKRALLALSLCGEELPQLREALSLAAAEQQGRSSNFPVRPDMLGQEGVVIGREESSGLPFLWSDHTKSILITGAIGGGKTNLVLGVIAQLAARGVTCWVFDRRKDYLPLLGAACDCHVIPWNALRLNIMVAPPGVDRESWIGTVSEAFCHTYSLLTGSKSLFEEVFSLVWEEATEEGRTPTFLDVCERFARRDYLAVRTRADADYRGRIHDRLRLIRRKAAKMLACEAGFDLVSLSECGHPVIFDVSAEEQFRDFLILVLMWYVWCYRKDNPGDHPPFMFVLDEARYTLRERKGAQEHYILDIDQLATGARPFNVGFMIAEQVPSQLSKAVANNTQLKVAFNTQADEIPFMGRILGLSREQAEKLRSLEVGQCIASLGGSRCPVPVLLRVPGFRSQRVAPESVKRREDETVRILGESVVSQREPMGTRQDDTGADILREAGQHPFRGISEHMKALGMSRSRFYRELHILVERGYLSSQRVSTKGRPMKLLELSEKGVALLRTVERDELELSDYHGGIAHGYWMYELEKRLRRAHVVESCRRLACGRIPDLLVDEHLAIEIEASDNAMAAVEKYGDIIQEVGDLLVVVEEANSPGLLAILESALARSDAKVERAVRVLRVQDYLKEVP